MLRKGLWMIAALFLILAGCADQGGRDAFSKTNIGTVGGAVVGGVVGEQLLGDRSGLLVGGVIGALAGRELGKRWDARDDRQAFSAFEENRPVTWRDDDADARYSINPTDTYYRDGRLCRNFSSQIIVEGDRETATGTACRRPNGTWEVIG